MKASELRDKTSDELLQEKEKLLQEQFNLRMQKGTGQLGQPHLLKAVRLNIARINTIIHEKKLNERKTGEQ